MGIKFILDDIYQFQCDYDKNFIHAVYVLMDSVDDSPFPLWPIDELRLEEINTIGIGEYDNYSGGDIIVEKVSFTQRSQRSNESSDVKP